MSEVLGRKPVWIVTISGIKWAFSSHPDWTGTLDATYAEVKPYLDGTSLKITGERWTLRDGKGTPGTLKFGIFNQKTAAHPDGDLLWLTATDLAAAATSNLMEAKLFSSAGGEILYVEDHAAFDAAGILYVGLEAMSYTSKTNAGGGVPYDRFNGVQRGIYGSMGGRHVITGTLDPDWRSNPEVSSHPRTWGGRYVTLWEASSVADTTPVVVWRGFLSDFALDDKGHTLIFNARSLLAALERETGTQPQGAQLADASLLPPSVGGNEVFWYLDDSTVAQIITCSSVLWEDGHTTTTLAWAGSYTWITYVLGYATAISDPGYEFLIGTDYGMGDQRVYIRNQSTLHTIKGVWIHAELAQAAGFDADAFGEVLQGQYILAPRNRSAFFCSSWCKRIYVSNSTLVLATPPVGSPFLGNMIEVDIKNSVIEGKEILRIEALTADTPYPGITQVDLSVRGMGGDGMTYKSYPIWSDAVVPTLVREVLYSTLIRASDFLQYLLAGCDGQGFNGPYDVLGPGWGGEIPAAFIDTPSFSLFGGPVERQYVGKPITLAELFQASFQAEGIGLATVNGKLTCVKIGDASVSRASPLTDNELVTGQAVARLAQDVSLLVNRIELSYNWDVQEESFAVEKQMSFAADAKSIAAGVGLVAIEHKGLIFRTTEQATAYRADMAGNAFSRWGTAPWVVGPLEFQRWRRATPLQIGESVLLTLAQIPNPYTGTRGLSQALAYVHAAEYDLKRGTVRATLILSRQSRRVGNYAPAVEVVSYGTTWLVVDGTEINYPYTATETFFHVGDEITIYRAKAEGATWSGSVLGFDYGPPYRLQIGAAVVLSDGNPPAAGDRVRYRSWSLVDISQRVYAYIA